MKGLAKNIAASVLLAATMNTAFAAEPTADGKITGTMKIDFASRRESGISIDTYASDITFAQEKVAFNIANEINRQFNGATSLGFVFDKVAFSVGKAGSDGKIVSGTSIKVGNLSGVMSIDKTGVYSFPGDNGLAFEKRKGNVTDSTGKYSGQIRGKRPKGFFKGLFSGLACSASNVAPAVITQVIGGKKIQIQLNDPDTLTFNAVSLPAGPLSTPNAVVNNDMKYGYTAPNKEDGTWAMNSITISNGSGKLDTLTGFINFVTIADKDIKAMDINGQHIIPTGYYDFSVRYNDNSTANTADADFAAASAAPASADDELAALAADTKVAQGISGRIWYVDSDQQARTITKNDCSKKETTIPARSDIYYDLQTHGLSYQQVQNFLKLWLLTIGPVNDP